MSLKDINYILSKLRLQRWPFQLKLFFVLSASFIANFPFSGGEDVINASENFDSPSRNDFWGGFAPFFYSLIPSTLLSTDTTYALIYLLLIGSGSWGINAFLQNENSNNQLSKSYLLLILTLIASLFSLQFSRDGTMLAFVWSSIGLFLFFHSQGFRVLLLFPVTLYVIGIAFRPWFGIVTIPLSIFIIRKLRLISSVSISRVFLSLLSLLLMILAPAILDRASVKALDMKSSYPQQQVMIMDASALACLSAKSSTVDSAIATLSIISNETNLTKATLCSFFYPQSWASVVSYNVTKSQSQNPIRMIEPSNEELYSSFLKKWLSLVAMNPAQYLQTKIMLSSQLLLAGDSRVTEDQFHKKLLLSPLTILRDLRLFSVLPFLLLILLSTWFWRKSLSKVEASAILMFYLFGVTSVAISFIGDNQRYLIPISIVTGLLTLVQSRAKRVPITS